MDFVESLDFFVTVQKLCRSVHIWHLSKLSLLM